MCPWIYTLSTEATWQPVLLVLSRKSLSFCSFLANGRKPNQLDITHHIVCNMTLSSSLIHFLFPYHWGHSLWALGNALHYTITTWLPEWLPYQTKMSEHQALSPKQTRTPRTHTAFSQKQFPRASLSLHYYVTSQGCLHFAENEKYQNRIKHIPIDSLQICKASGDGDACTEQPQQLQAASDWLFG